MCLRTGAGSRTYRLDLDRELLNLEPLRRLAQGFGRDAARIVERLIGGVGRGFCAAMPVD